MKTVLERAMAHFSLGAYCKCPSRVDEVWIDYLYRYHDTFNQMRENVVQGVKGSLLIPDPCIPLPGNVCVL